MPSTLLLAVHCKKSEPVALKEAVVEYVEETYGHKVGGRLLRPPGVQSAACPAASSRPPGAAVTAPCTLARVPERRPPRMLGTTWMRSRSCAPA